jgi:hypothetical protein
MRRKLAAVISAPHKGLFVFQKERKYAKRADSTAGNTPQKQPRTLTETAGYFLQ